MSPIAGPSDISHPYFTGFAFVAYQRGASDEQIGEVLEVSPRKITKSNEHISQLLAFPLTHAQDVTLGTVQAWYDTWAVEHSSIHGLSSVNLTEFRQLIDPWLERDHGLWKK
jgi:hypothetical protein